MRNIVIIIVFIAFGLFVFRIFSREKSKRIKVFLVKDEQSKLKFKQKEKEQIYSKLNEIRNRHLENLVNYEMTLLYRTDLDNQNIREKLSEKYPKTFSRMTFNFTLLYNEHEVALVDDCIIEILNSLGGKDFKSELNQPFLTFEFFIKNEAKEKARKLFDDFLDENKNLIIN